VRGSAGGYRLLDGYRTRLNGLSTREAEALFLTGLSGPAADLGLRATMAAAQLKLLVAMPADLRVGAERMVARFYLDVPGWFAEAEQPVNLQLVAGAVCEQRRIQMRYRSWWAEKQRIVEPLGLVLKGGAWYLVGRCDGDARTYRVGRILDLEVTAERFEPPAAFDLVEYWRAGTQRLEADLYKNRAVVRLSPWGVKMLEAFTSPFVRAGARTEDDAGPDGWRKAILPAGSIRQASLELLRFGAEAEVLDPPELRARMADIAREMGRIYQAYGERAPQIHRRLPRRP